MIGWFKKASKISGPFSKSSIVSNPVVPCLLSAILGSTFVSVSLYVDSISVYSESEISLAFSGFNVSSFTLISKGPKFLVNIKKPQIL